ncbi:MAG: hypothetical protein Pars2KO_26490 [Parasphingorhabdus sp.]
MMKEVSLLVGGAAVMALFLTPEAQTTELESGNRGQTAPTVLKKTSNVILDEDAYWEYDNDDVDEIVFGEPMVNADDGAINNDKTMFKTVPKKAADAKGKTDWKQEYPKPLS